MKIEYNITGQDPRELSEIKKVRRLRITTFNGQSFDIKEQEGGGILVLAGLEMSIVPHAANSITLYDGQRDCLDKHRGTKLDNPTA